jgi:hypothetical protein
VFHIKLVGEVKNLTKRFLSSDLAKSLPFVGSFAKRQYYRVGIPLLICNMIFQRFLRINGDMPWMVHYTSRVVKPENIFIEDAESSYTVYVSFAVSGNCYIQAGNGIHFGEGTIFAPGVKIISANHSYKEHSIQELIKY